MSKIKNFLEKLIPQPNVSTLNYNPALDGIRAIAVLFVILGHYFPGKVEPGYLGVDIFFVLSGFLISSIIFQSLKKNKFSFKIFYRNRIRRLFPALICLLLFCLVVGYLLVFPSYYKQIGMHVFSTGLYFQNFKLASEIGYFDTDRIYKPLLHTWSLAVEEQFYLIFPFLLFVVYKISKKLILFFIFLIFILSFIFSIIYFGQSPEKAYYMSLGRFWEFGLGILLAYIIFKKEKIKIIDKVKFKFNLKILEFFLFILSFFIAFKFLKNYDPIYLFIYLDIVNPLGFFSKRKKYTFFISFTLCR